MLPATPMNDQNNFPCLIVYVDNDIDDQRA
jgi:hypothetical protein